MKEMKDQLIEKVEKSMTGKLETEVNELKTTTESMTREIKEMKAEVDE